MANHTRRILLASSKGGAGKTTLATNLATAYAARGETVGLVDTDRQGSALRWSERRGDAASPVIGLSGLRRDWPQRLPAVDRVVIDSPAGVRAAEIAAYAEQLDAILVPVLPSAIDLEAVEPFLGELAELPALRSGKLRLGLVGNRLRPWTMASQLAVEAMQGLPFPLVAELRDTQAYVLAHALGRSLFDYHTERVRSHQEDWKKLLRWLDRAA